MSKENITFQKIGNYEYPGSPVHTHAKRYYSRIVRLLKNDDDQAYIAQDDLDNVAQEKIDQIVTLPAYGSLMEELDNTVHDWANNDDAADQFKLIILPSGDNDLVARWAKQKKFKILNAPDKKYLMSDFEHFEINLQDNDGLLVIPRLEKWFLRHRNGLATIRYLFKYLQENDIKCLIGCNSWAWQFLQKSLNLQFFLPEGLMFEPYTQDRLETWFKSMVEDTKIDNISFKSTKKGDDIFEKDDEDNLKHDYLKELSAQSLGIPWVAWHLWRKSLRTKNDDFYGSINLMGCRIR